MLMNTPFNFDAFTESHLGLLITYLDCPMGFMPACRGVRLQLWTDFTLMESFGVGAKGFSGQ